MGGMRFSPHSVGLPNSGTVLDREYVHNTHGEALPTHHSPTRRSSSTVKVHLPSSLAPAESAGLYAKHTAAPAPPETGVSGEAIACAQPLQGSDGAGRDR